MCEFCAKHGEGKKWYLQIKNYSDELLNIQNRKEFIKYLILNFETIVPQILKKLKKINSYPSAVRNFLKNIGLKHQKKLHYGQVVPIEDVEKILQFTNSVTFLPCACRKVTKGVEKKYCFGLSVPPQDVPDEIVKKYPTALESLEVMKSEEALKIIKDFDSSGLYHSIWTFKTPYIGGLCNCDMDCVGFRARQYLNFPAFFKSEYIGEINIDKCNGCRECQKICQFGAVNFSFLSMKCYINKEVCYGCGICRNVCRRNAISLIDRAKFSDCSRNW